MENTKENNITIGWLIYLICSIVIICLGAISQNSGIPIIIASVFGTIYTLLIAKEKRIAFLFGIVNVLIYGFILLKQEIYGGAIYNLLYGFPILTWGYIKWKKVQNKENSGIKKISKNNRIKLIFIVSIIALIYGVILKNIGGNNYILDSITSILAYIALYLVSNKYIEQWIAWIICNGANVILWLKLTFESSNNIAILLMWMIYLINSIYGYIVWKKLYEGVNHGK